MALLGFSLLLLAAWLNTEHFLPWNSFHSEVFNGQLWPDFTAIPSAQRPILQLLPFAVGDTLRLGPSGRVRHIEVLPAAHTVPACGFAIAIWIV